MSGKSNQEFQPNIEEQRESNSAGGSASDSLSAFQREAQDILLNGSMKRDKVERDSSESRDQAGGESSREGRDSVQRPSDESIRRIDRELSERRVVFVGTQDGVTELPKGDKLVKDGDREILLMANGDKVAVNADGSYEIKSQGGAKVKSEGGVTTVTFANGNEVTFTKAGIGTVKNGNVTTQIIHNRVDHPVAPVLPLPYDGQKR